MRFRLTVYTTNLEDGMFINVFENDRLLMHSNSSSPCETTEAFYGNLLRAMALREIHAVSNLEKSTEGDEQFNYVVTSTLLTLEQLCKFANVPDYSYDL